MARIPGLEDYIREHPNVEVRLPPDISRKEVKQLSDMFLEFRDSDVVPLLLYLTSDEPIYLSHWLDRDDSAPFTYRGQQNFVRASSHGIVDVMQKAMAGQLDLGKIIFYLVERRLPNAFLPHFGELKDLKISDVKIEVLQRARQGFRKTVLLQPET